jgi:hypothetical protein
MSGIPRRLLPVLAVFTLSCASSTSIPPIEDSLRLKLSVLPQPVPAGKTAVVLHTLTNVGGGSVTFCRTGFSALGIGGVQTRRSHFGGPGCSDPLVTLHAGEELEWQERLDLANCQPPKSNPEHPELDRLMGCVGQLLVSASVEIRTPEGRLTSLKAQSTALVKSPD